MDKKTVFAALFLLFVLYIVGVGLGVGETEVAVGADIDAPGWVEALSRFADRALSPEDVSEANPPGCLQDLREGLFVLTAGGTCTLTVEESASRFCTRTLRLKLIEGAGATVVLDHRDEDLPSQSGELERGDEDPLIVRFMRGGGTVSITCTGAPGGSPCRIQVVE
ncbi:MAG: hypothetical protein WD645_01445 [Dehalococcoidia bacterium]